MGWIHLHQTRSFIFPASINSEALKRTALLALLLIISLIGAAQRPENYCLKVKLMPTVDGAVMKGASYKLYCEGVVVASMDTLNKRKAVFYLQRDSSYLLEVSLPGRLTRTVAINTRMPDDFPDLKYKCAMQVELPSALGLINSYYKDFPVAIVEFNENIPGFEHKRDYTETVRRHMEEEPEEEPLIPGTAVNYDNQTAPVAKTEK